MPPHVRTSIHGIAAGGAGVGRLPDGRVVFVHRTAPGDEVDVELTEERARHAKGRALRIVQAGPDRRSAPCPHYARCGGCTLEHITYPAQLEAKAVIVTENLRRIGRLPADRPHVVPSPLEFRYRNRVSFTLLRTRTGTVVAGFHELDRPDRILDIDGTCLLPEPAIAQTWDALRLHWGPAAERLPAGRSLRLTLRATASSATSLLIEGGHGRGRPAELLDMVPSLDAIWLRTTPTDPPRRLAGSHSLLEQWQDETVSLSGTAFLQVNRQAAARLEAYVLQCAGAVTGFTVIDAYCGIGLLTHRLAARGARAVGIEADDSAVLEARRRVTPGADFRHGSVESLLPAALPADLVVLNPPRAGVHPIVTQTLVARPVARLIYVSCNPATLARDVARLAPTYDARSVRCFDLFPQTAHVETVVELVCDTSSR
jgi:23S rRNA (uracil1939-C5)-methyltransferase